MNISTRRGLEFLDSLGKPIFGLVFWGSVGGALMHSACPDLPLPTAQAIGAIGGLAAGLRARKRQAWI